MLSVIILLLLFMIIRGYSICKTQIGGYTKNIQENFNNHNIVSYCINLLDNIDRWDNIIEQQKRLFFTIQKVNAVDTRGDKWLQYTDKLTTETKNKLINTIHNNIRIDHMDLTPGAIGCFLSHLNVYEKIMKTADNDKYYLIIEDDTEFNIDFDNTILNNEIKNIPTDWDIILFN